MIHLYTWSTPNGRKVSIALEELGLAYDVHPIDIGKDEQFAPDFLKISPNNKIPAILDDETDQALFESGAILLYLAKKTGRLLPEDEAGRWSVMQWLMWQMGGQGPMLGQAHHFLRFNVGKAPYAEERYHNEAKRLYGVLDRQLAENDHVAGPTLTIADIAIWPWCSRYEWQQIDLNDFANVKRWYLELAARSGFRAGYKVPNPDHEIPLPG
ncbi:MAG: glutathione S-transferase N-terminal domain-containing protein [Kiloniellales bacterium]